MLEGLEVSEILFSYLNKNSILRIDSQFYKKEFLCQENLIGRINHKRLIDFGNKILSFGAYSLNNHVSYKQTGIPFIRGINLKQGRIDFSNIIYIDENENKLLWKSEVKPLTILLSMSGTIGDVALASEDLAYPINSNQDIAKIHPSNNINQFFLYAFFRSKYGQNYLKREARGSVQQHVFLSQIECFEIPIFSDKFDKKIEKTVRASDDCSLRSKKTYTQAEDLLLTEIGLKGFQPTDEGINIKTFAESFATIGRLDAEYYQPKYEDYLKLVTSYKNGHKLIAKGCNVKLKNHKPDNDKEYKYIELSNVGKAGNINGCTFDFGKELPSRARRKVSTGDVIISSIEGSLNSCALVTNDYNNGLCSTGFYVINSDEINSQTLLVLFKSELIQNILKQNCSGTILTAINKDEFLNIPLPIIERGIQQKIAEFIEESFALKKHSEHLLEVAKTAVEMAIEENEVVAMAYIEREVGLDE